VQPPLYTERDIAFREFTGDGTRRLSA
jgi:hypothetical protein